MTACDSRNILAIVAFVAAGALTTSWGQSPPTETRSFTDPIYGFSLRLPPAWKPYVGTVAGPPRKRLALTTPNGNILIVSVSPLPNAVPDHSAFEEIGQTYVDPVVQTYGKNFGASTFLGEHKEDHSNATGMQFWQGTSGVDSSNRPVMILSLHAIRYGSRSMVNIVYVCRGDSKQEVVQVDKLMASLSFTNR